MGSEIRKWGGGTGLWTEEKAEEAGTILAIENHRGVLAKTRPPASLSSPVHPDSSTCHGYQILGDFRGDAGKRGMSVRLLCLQVFCAFFF